MRHDVEQWFHSKTLTSQQFDRHELAAVKTGTSVSVVLPAHDEAATVGVIVEALRREPPEETALVDEIVVVDSGSEDDTVEVARAAGASVVRHDRGPGGVHRRGSP